MYSRQCAKNKELISLLLEQSPILESMFPLICLIHSPSLLPRPHRYTKIKKNEKETRNKRTKIKILKAKNALMISKINGQCTNIPVKS
jgi:hypothetical protein